MGPDGRRDTAPGSDEVWVFGEEPLDQSLELAPLLRRVVGLALSLEEPAAALDRLIAELRRAESDLVALAPADPAPRLGVDASPGQRVYIDHGRDVGAFNPLFPEYEIVVEGPLARGTVEFPLAFEGPPGLVHGGVIATFFDLVLQHHNCVVGQAGKTTSLQLRYRRPTPICVELQFEIDRTVEADRITSEARLLRGDEALAIATMQAVAGKRSNLPFVSPRRVSP